MSWIIISGYLSSCVIYTLYNAGGFRGGRGGGRGGGGWPSGGGGGYGDGGYDVTDTMAVPSNKVRH